MDPLSTLSVVAAAVQLVDFGSRLISNTREIYHSVSGQTSEMVELSAVAADLSQLTTNISDHITVLGEARPAKGSSEQVLLNICVQCRDVATGLEDALD